MPSTRRRFLAGATVLAASVAGCNEESQRSVGGTVTPVTVPRTDEEILREATAIDAPSVPSPVVVTDAHHAAAVEHAETLRDSITERLESVDGSVDDGHVGRSPEAVLEDAEDQLEAARGASPSEEALETLRRAVEDLARADGLLGVELGDVDADSLRAGIETERATTDALFDRVDYRIARPVADSLPTAYAAERTLDGVRDLRNAERDLEEAEADEEPRPRVLATVYRNLEGRRRRRDDAERYLEAATDPDAPSLRPAIQLELDELEEELAAVADGVSDRERESTDGEAAADEIRSIRWNVGERTARYRSELSNYREDGRRLRGLFGAVRQKVEFESIDAAVERTVPLLREREFPTGRLLEEKRGAVEALERAAGGSPVQRQFAANARQLLSAADRYGQSDSTDARQAAQIHLQYVGAAEWADRGLSRGDSLSSSLQAQQS